MKQVKTFANETFFAGAVHDTPTWYNGATNRECVKFTLVTKRFKKFAENKEQCEYHNVFLTPDVAAKAKESGLKKGSFINMKCHCHYSEYYEPKKRALQSETQFYCSDPESFSILENNGDAK